MDICENMWYYICKDTEKERECMKKVLCILLAALMIPCTVLLSACAEKPATDDTTSAENVTGAVTEPEVTEITADLPDVKFNNKPFRVILQEDSSGDIYTEDHEIGEPIHDAVFERNIKVCEKYGVELQVSKDEYTAAASRRARTNTICASSTW